MKNKYLLLVSFFIIFILPASSYCQNIGNYFDLNIAFNYSLPVGQSEIKKDINGLFEYNDPFLYSNMQGEYNYALAFIYKPKSFYTLGFRFKSKNSFFDRDSIVNDKFSKTILSLRSYSLLWGLKIPIEKIKGLRNFRFVSYFSPGLYEIEYVNQMKDYPITILNSSNNNGVPSEIIITEIDKREHYNSYGLEISLYLEYQFVNRMVFFFEYGYDIIKTNSENYMDKYFCSNNFYLGVSLKLMKDKRFYY